MLFVRDNDGPCLLTQVRSVMFLAGGMDATEFEDLMEELGELSGSDSGPEVDTLSMSSTPKPSLRPFFSSSRSLVHDTLNVPGTGELSFSST